MPFIAAALFLLASCYPFNLSLKLRPLSLSLGDYTGGFIITYKDGSSVGPFLPGDTVLTAGKTIKSITPVGKPPILIGRPDTDAINLNIDAGGNLDFRPADGGFIPIGSYAEFRLIGTSGTYKLEADLDLMGEGWTGVGNWTPVDLAAGRTFDGNGKSIHNLFVNSSTAGLFGSVASGATVENVHIRSGSVTGPVSSTVGGIVGSNNGIINACSNAATITGSTGSNNGGIVGSNNGMITACYNTGEVSGDGNIGGVVGVNNNTITACYNTGAIFGTGGLGGVAGENHYTITACYNTGAVSGNGGLGGVAGQSGGTGTITACYNTGAVSGTGNIGGVLGNGSATVASNYWRDGVGTANFGIGYLLSNTNATPFSSAAWPTTATHTQWRPGDNTANGSGDGQYWKSLGSYGGAYPRLWYE